MVAPSSGLPPGDKALDLIAERFRLLGDVTRLRLLSALAQGEMPVAALVAATGANQANVSKHLGLLTRAGMLRRRKAGLQVFYSVADPRVFDLCRMVCGSVSDRLEQDLSAVRASPPSRSPRPPLKRGRRRGL